MQPQLVVIKSSATWPKAAFTSMLVGSVPAAIVEYAIGNWFSGYFGTGIALTTLFGVAGAVWKTGWNTNVPLGSVAVHQFRGHVTGHLYGSGDLYGIPGLDKYNLVVMKEQPTNVDKFEDVTGDNSKIYITGFFNVKTCDPFKTYTIGTPIDLLKGSYKASVKSFVNVWKTSIYVKDQKQLLHMFMSLPADKQSPEHVDFRLQLEKLTRKDGDREAYLTMDGVDAIMQAAGSFVGDVERIGLYLIEARVDAADIDASITQSINDRIAETERMKKFQIQHEQRMSMAKDFMKADTDNRMTMRDAVNLADRAMGLGVTTNINELDLRDAHMIAELLKGVAEPVAKAFKAWAESKTSNIGTKP